MSKHGHAAKNVKVSYFLCIIFSINLISAILSVWGIDMILKLIKNLVYINRWNEECQD